MDMLELEPKDVVGSSRHIGFNVWFPTDWT